MEKKFWSNTDLHRLFRLDTKVKSRQTLLNAEERGEIPKANRVARGSTLVRQWTLDQLPEIGARFGFLKKPNKQQIICVYTAKGGVLKTTLAYSLARILALNGLKTIVIGLDIQCSITDIALPPSEVESLDDFKNQHLGLYHHLFDKVPLDKIIQRTALPTLSIIPETTDLNVLEKKLRLESRREYLFKDKLVPQLQEYDVIIFDNGPSWNQLIENALTTSNSIISPIGCDIGTYQALQTNLNTLFEFQTAMKLDWDNFFLIPTLLEKTKLSQQIYGAYLNQYAEKVLPTPIRRGVKGQEAILLRQSAIEHDPKSPLAQDYFELTQELWNRIIENRE
ncbi:MAG: ParA family protein [Gammaproteobacteria bacterium]|nr:ParA family protein [Gammaproteobacteria bacterium]